MKKFTMSKKLTSTAKLLHLKGFKIFLKISTGIVDKMSTNLL